VAECAVGVPLRIAYEHPAVGNHWVLHQFLNARVQGGIGDVQWGLPEAHQRAVGSGKRSIRALPHVGLVAVEEGLVVQHLSVEAKQAGVAV
jgi:hypothetical protein